MAKSRITQTTPHNNLYLCFLTPDILAKREQVIVSGSTNYKWDKLKLANSQK